jgi:hypothetical protein
MTIVFPLLFKLLPGKEFRAMAFWPFIFVKEKILIYDSIIMNHEKIHLAQQKELLVLPFYLLYFSEFILYRLSMKNYEQAYLKISFEQEAYKFDKDLTYLKKRKLWANFRSN